MSLCLWSRDHNLEKGLRFYDTHELWRLQKDEKLKVAVVVKGERRDMWKFEVPDPEYNRSVSWLTN